MTNFSERSLTKNSEQESPYNKAKQYSTKHAKNRIRLPQTTKSPTCKTENNKATTQYNVKKRGKVMEFM
jgi:hypothetical protein